MRWIRRKGKKVGQTPAPTDSPLSVPAAKPKDIVCRYCGPVYAVPDEHLDSPEHRLAQAAALLPDGDGADDAG